MAQRFRRAAIVTAATVLFVFLGGASVVTAWDGAPRPDEVGQPIRGQDLDRALDAALAETGGGQVTGTESVDEESRYEVEVTLPDGRQVDVQLDESFAVIDTPGDDGAGVG